MGNGYQAEFYRIHEYRLRNLNFKNVKISQKCKKTSQFYHKTVFCAFYSQNLIKNSQNFKSGFFPDFPDPVFSRKKRVREVAGGQTLGHFVSYMNIFHILYEFIWWQKVADMKNAKNYFYLVSESSKFLQNSNSISFFIVDVKLNSILRFLPH